MKKKFLIPALAFTVIGGGIGASVINTPAFAAKANASSKAEVSDQKEQKQLEKEATITKQESMAIALKTVPGKAKDAELEDENGVVVYGVEVFDAKGQKHDVKVNAKTGKVLKVESNGENEGEKGNKEKSDGEVSDKQEQILLQKQAKITKAESIDAALKEVPGKATKAELEDEDGVAVYGVQVTDNQGKKYDVKVDAKSGKVLKAESDDNEKNSAEKNDSETNDDNQ